MRFDFLLMFGVLVAGLLSGCGGDSGLSGDPDDGGLTLPDGFEALVVADSIGPARHLAVRNNGDIYATLRRRYEDGSIVALRDTTDDGKADIIKKFGVYGKEESGFNTGANIHNGYLYVSTNLNVYRYKLKPGQLLPESEPDTIVVDDHEHGSHEHITKPISFDGEGNMYIPFGAPNNACQDPKRTPGVAGLDPCPFLEDHGGVWRFDANEKNQTQADGYKYATGLRSVVAQDWGPDDNLYILMHGRDNLHRLWPNRFARWDNAMLPAEEFIRVTESSNFGWPYCYYDQLQGKKVLAPEYGGDGSEVGRCSKFDDPIIGFPGHFAPNDLMFYQGSQFPGHYENGAFMAFHGSTIRNPYPQAGYFVAFVPFEDGKQSEEWEVFANGFAGVDPIVNTSDAEHRPAGLEMGPDGSLYITEDNDGKIWRVIFTGDKGDFGESNLAEMEKEKRTASNVRTPDKVADNLEADTVKTAGGMPGEEIYNTYCATCHQGNGEGAPPRYPPVTESDWVTGDKRRLISVIVNGLEGPIEVNGERYNNAMPQHSFLSDEEVANVATYIRQNFGNEASAVRVEEVQEIRASSSSDN